MRVLWLSDSPETASGFGNVTRFVCGGLASRGYAVDILGWQTTEEHDWNGCRVFPRGRESMGADSVYGLLVRRRPEAVIGLGDVWWMPFMASPHVRRQLELLGTPWMLYFPIDGDTGDDRLPASWIDSLRDVDIPIAMSEYGRRIARACGIDCELIPHGVDCSVFSPPADRTAVKRELGYDGRFVILSDSRNQPRKLLPRLLQIVRGVADRVPNVLLHLHTDPDDEFTRSAYYSYDVRADIAHLGLGDHVRLSPKFSILDGGLPLSQLARYYQAADVHLLASSGEGFGLPTLQAAAAGAVPIAGAYSASEELSSPHGISIAIDDYSANEFGIRRSTLSISDAVDRIVALANDPVELAERSRRSREFAERYRWEDILNQWDRLLQSVSRRRATSSGSFGRRAAAPDQTLTQTIETIAGASVTVKMLLREAGRLESSISADMRKCSTDIRIPAVPKAWMCGEFRILRDPGLVAMSRGDDAIFNDLFAIFPILERCEIDVTTSETLVDQLGHAILLLDVSGELPESVLVDAATLGIPVVASSRTPLATRLWPELLATNDRHAVEIARTLLTDLPFNAHCIAQARASLGSACVIDDRALVARLRFAASRRRDALAVGA